MINTKNLPAVLETIPEQNIIEEIFDFEPNPHLTLDEFLKNIRWEQQTDILYCVEVFLRELSRDLDVKTLGDLSTIESNVLISKKKKLLELINEQAFTRRLEQSEYLGWRSLIDQIKNMIEKSKTKSP